MLSVNASKRGLGAACLQDGNPVAHGSRALTEAKSRYAQIEKELLGATFACKKIYGLRSTVEKASLKLTTSLLLQSSTSLFILHQPFCFPVENLEALLKNGIFIMLPVALISHSPMAWLRMQ